MAVIRVRLFDNIRTNVRIKKSRIAVSGRGAEYAQRGLRPLGVADTPALRNHLLGLHPEDRWARFAHPVSDLRVERYVEGIDWTRSLILGWHSEGVLRAAAQAHWPDAAWLHGNAELALSVERPWQRRGVGTMLVATIGTVARMRRLPGLYLSAQTDDDAVRRLAQRLGIPLRRQGGAVEGFLPLDPHGCEPGWLSAVRSGYGIEPGGRIGR